MEEFHPAPDIDDLLLGALEPEPDDIPDDLEESPLGGMPGAFVSAMRQAVLIEDGRLRPRSKLEVSFLGALERFEVKLIRVDGTTRVVRAPTLGMCLAVINDVEDYGREIELDVGGVWVCADCHGLKLRFAAGEVGEGRGELVLCPSCTTDLDEEVEDEGDEPQHALD